MNTNTSPDPEEETLTITTRGEQTWITCRSGENEVTVGPFATDAIAAGFPTDPMDGGVTAALIEKETEESPSVDYEAMWWDAERRAEKAECPDPEVHEGGPFDLAVIFRDERDEARATAALWKEATREHVGRSRTALSWAEMCEESARTSNARAEKAEDTLSLVQQQRDQATARAEKATAQLHDALDEQAKLIRERDEAIAFMTEAQEEATRQAVRADTAESRPLTPDADAYERGVPVLRDACPDGFKLSIPAHEAVRAIVAAVLAEPPARPEGAEEIESILAHLPDTMLPATDAGRADLLASRGVRVVGGDGAA